MLGGESPPSRYAWSRRTREAPGCHREVGSEGSVERMCGARDTNRIRGVVGSGRVGTRPRSPLASNNDSPAAESSNECGLKTVRKRGGDHENRRQYKSLQPIDGRRGDRSKG